MTDHKTIEAAVKEAAAAHEGKLPCAVAHELARRLQVPLPQVGQVADDLQIKIIKCQLGCF